MPQLLLKISSKLGIGNDEEVISKETLTEPAILTQSLEAFRVMVNDAFTKKILDSLGGSDSEQHRSQPLTPQSHIYVGRMELRSFYKKKEKSFSQDANIIIDPNAIPMELKIWDAAFTHGRDCLSNSQSGLKKNLNPWSAPSRLGLADLLFR
ncbi:unnamed protein product [Leptidea sinapis]|uniref:Uncharacterized protein n=1 Tax=Leptidea sinapis TaxID=189913 RepID=A0A5E4QXA1_9NEOP|nr:unnamed protein product [Leptidea sinapis]